MAAWFVTEEDRDLAITEGATSSLNRSTTLAEAVGELGEGEGIRRY